MVYDDGVVPACGTGLGLRRARRYRKKAAAAPRMTAMGMPTPMPALAPVLKPLDELSAAAALFVGAVELVVWVLVCVLVEVVIVVCVADEGVVVVAAWVRLKE